ncbi:hypothetical protein ZWY2020_047915 [Hordeum vulgare]|nr:hypothetical protein ZWY2020_047915 [Hordeum vulgare]
MKIVAVVVFERFPVVIPKIHPVVYAFQEFSYSKSARLSSSLALLPHSRPPSPPPARVSVDRGGCAQRQVHREGEERGEDAGAGAVIFADRCADIMGGHGREAEEGNCCPDSCPTVAWTSASRQAAENGQLGHGDTLLRNLPTFVSELSKYNIIAAGVGRKHKVVVTDEGKSFAVGDNKHGQLGTGSL